MKKRVNKKIKMKDRNKSKKKKQTEGVVKI